MQFSKHAIPLAMLGLAILVALGCNRTSSQTKFATAEAAAAALKEALQADDLERMQAIFGREWMQLAGSGDSVADQNDRQVIALAMDQSWRWAPHGTGAQELIIGDEQWPFPVPLVKTGNAWQFDSEAGLEEVLARKIGANELGVIRICHDYVRAQKEYASQPHDGKPAGLFAQRFRSTPGHQDGLYWGPKRGEQNSPLHELVTAAVAEGYDPNKADASPFRGYRFRILTAQGPAAPGGQKSYVVNGDMTGGFALLAWPAKYAFSGVTSFVVGPDGVVYQKDLGDDTVAQALLPAEYDPDKSWTAVSP
jgi:hypothetical protein